MERKTSLFSFFALANASGPHGYQSTGLWACCSRYGLVSWARRLAFFALGSFGDSLSAAIPAGRDNSRPSNAATIDCLMGKLLVAVRSGRRAAHRYGAIAPLRAAVEARRRAGRGRRADSGRSIRSGWAVP